MWELDDESIKHKLLQFAGSSGLVTWSRTAELDMARTAGLTRKGVLEAVVEHINCSQVVYEDVMDNGDEAFVFKCKVGRHRRYVKVKFIQLGEEERMHVISAHDD